MGVVRGRGLVVRVVGGRGERGVREWGRGEGRRGEQQRGERDATVHASKHDDDSDNGTDDSDQQY